MNTKFLRFIKSKNFIVFILSFLIIAIFSGKILPDPYASRVMAIRSIVDYKTFSIDNITDLDTIDKFFYNGHYYSSKPPLLTLVGAGIYFILKTATGSPFNQTIYYITCLFTTGLAFALTLMFFFKSMRWFEISDGYKILFTAILGFGTLLLPYSTMLHNHTITALFVFLAFYNILKIKFCGDKNIFFLLIGFFMSLAIVTETTQSAIIYLIFFLYFLFKKSTRKKSYLLIISALPIGILYMMYNLRTTGSIFPPYINFETLYKYSGSYWNNPSTTEALNHNKPLYIFNMLFGTQGIFLYSPVLIFGFWGMLKTIRDKNKIWVNEAKLVLSSCIAILSFLAITTNNYGGKAYGLRWFIVCVPMVMFFTPILIPYLKNKKFAIAFLCLSFISLFFSFLGIPGNWTAQMFNFSGIPLYFPLLDSLRFQLHNIIRA